MKHKFRKPEPEIKVEIVSVENTTTRTVVDLKKKKVNLIGIDPEGITLEVPHHTCANGHNIGFTVNITDRTGKSAVEATAKVNEIVRSDDCEQIHLKLMNYDQVAWEILLSSLQQRQTKIADLFDKIRAAG